MRAGLGAALAAVVLLAAHAAHADQVCESPETQAAFVKMTAFMSLTPLALIGGLIVAAVRRMRAAERAHELFAADGSAAPTDER